MKARSTIKREIQRLAKLESKCRTLEERHDIYNAKVTLQWVMGEFWLSPMTRSKDWIGGLKKLNKTVDKD